MGFRGPTTLEKLAMTKRDRDKCISLSGLELDSLPLELGEFSWLREVGLHMNRLTDDSPGLDVLAQLKHLESLGIGRNRFRYIPKVVEHCVMLRKLDVSENQIGSLPTWLFKLPLRNLDLESNPISTLPVDICGSNDLEILRLMGTPLKSLPLDIGMCRRLEALDLRGCPVESLPESLLDTKLNWLGLQGNTALQIPEEILATESAKKILRYYFEKVSPVKDPNRIVPWKKPSPYPNIEEAGTAGEDTSTSSLIKWLVKWRKTCEFDVTEATASTLVLKFKTLPEDLDGFVKAAGRICPEFAVSSNDWKQEVRNAVVNHKELTLWWD